jgi:uncharacterized membrane protein YfcA
LAAIGGIGFYDGFFGPGTGNNNAPALVATLVVRAPADTARSVLGAHTAVKHGSKFVRVVFLAIVIALIAKTGADAWGL